MENCHKNDDSLDENRERFQKRTSEVTVYYESKLADERNAYETTLNERNMTIENLNDRLMASIPSGAETEENNEYITNIEDINNANQTDICTDTKLQELSASLLNSVTKIIDEKIVKLGENIDRKFASISENINKNCTSYAEALKINLSLSANEEPVKGPQDIKAIVKEALTEMKGDEMDIEDRKKNFVLLPNHNLMQLMNENKKTYPLL